MTGRSATTPGVLLASNDRVHLAWCGVRVTPVGVPAFADLTRDEARSAALRAEAGWLSAYRAAAAAGALDGSSIELRYRSEPGAAGRTCALLARVRAATADAAWSGALVLRSRLTELPAHLRAIPITADNELAGWLTPFHGDDLDLVELRKPWYVSGSAALGPGTHAATTALPQAGPDAVPAWAPLWDALGRHPHPVVLAIGLTPRRLTAEDHDRLRALTGFYRARAAGVDDPLYATSRPVDAAVRELADRYADAATRYRDGGFRLRIGMASDARLPDLLVRHLAGAIWRTPGDGGPAVVRPAPAEHALAARQFAACGPSTWDEGYLRGLADPPAGVRRLVAELADVPEAMAAFRLPPPATIPPRATHRHPPGTHPTAGPPGSTADALHELGAAVSALSARIDHADGTAVRQVSVLEGTLRQWGQVLLDELSRTRCPRVFTLVPIGGRWDGATRLELRLYCEQPNGWHPLPDDLGVYTITEPAPWLKHAGPYLRVVIPLLRHAAALASPVLGVVAAPFAKRLSAELSLAAALVGQLPDPPGTADPAGPAVGRARGTAPAAAASLDAEFRTLEGLLLGLDPQRSWGGLSSVAMSDWQVRYLCPDHARAARDGRT